MSKRVPLIMQVLVSQLQYNLEMLQLIGNRCS
jgi:hypothetical protein